MCKSNAIKVLGQTVDKESRCVHYHSQKDIIAIKFYCCNDYYPCYQCHEEQADHLIKSWPKTLFNQNAVLCGKCKKELSIHNYLKCNSICPTCQAEFNPGCQLHYHHYFEK
jgi:uncharacterized CHY-type Zn-finger protein